MSACRRSGHSAPRCRCQRESGKDRDGERNQCSPHSVSPPSLCRPRGGVPRHLRGATGWPRLNSCNYATTVRRGITCFPSRGEGCRGTAWADRDGEAGRSACLQAGARRRATYEETASRRNPFLLSPEDVPFRADSFHPQGQSKTRARACRVLGRNVAPTTANLTIRLVQNVGMAAEKSLGAPETAVRLTLSEWGRRTLSIPRKAGDRSAQRR